MGNSASIVLATMADRVLTPERTDMPSSATIDGTTRKKNITGILAFEAGAIMAKGLDLWHGLDTTQISSLKTSLQAPGIISLVSHDFHKLWALAGMEKQKELDALASRIAIIGMKCQNRKLQNLKAVFKQLAKKDAELGPLDLSNKEMQTLLGFLKAQAEVCFKLKWEMEALQSLEKRSRTIRWESKPADLMDQREVVRRMQQQAVWSQDVDTLVRLLVLMVCMIRKKIFATFGGPISAESFELNSLGSAGLHLHYAHIIVLIEKIIEHPSMVEGSARDDLYKMLPRDIRVNVRARLRPSVRPRLAQGVEANLMRSMSLLPPLAHSTLSWHTEHSPGSAFLKKPAVSLLQTLYYAHKPTVNAALLDILVGLCCICLPEAPPAPAPGPAPGEEEPDRPAFVPPHLPPGTSSMDGGAASARQLEEGGRGEEEEEQAGVRKEHATAMDDGVDFGTSPPPEGSHRAAGLAEYDAWKSGGGAASPAAAAAAFSGGGGGGGAGGGAAAAAGKPLTPSDSFKELRERLVGMGSSRSVGVGAGKNGSTSGGLGSRGRATTSGPPYFGPKLWARSKSPSDSQGAGARSPAGAAERAGATRGVFNSIAQSLSRSDSLPKMAAVRVPGRTSQVQSQAAAAKDGGGGSPGLSKSKTAARGGGGISSSSSGESGGSVGLAVGTESEGAAPRAAFKSLLRTSSAVDPPSARAAMTAVSMRDNSRRSPTGKGPGFESAVPLDLSKSISETESEMDNAEDGSVNGALDSREASTTPDLKEGPSENGHGRQHAEIEAEKVAVA
eukprot:jgi/Mesen1/7270/ME000373S06350